MRTKSLIRRGTATVAGAGLAASAFSGCVDKPTYETIEACPENYPVVAGEAFSVSATQDAYGAFRGGVSELIARYGQSEIIRSSKFKR